MSYDSDLTNSQWELIKDVVYVGYSAEIDRKLLIYKMGGDMQGV